jgi:hypothetical protein
LAQSAVPNTSSAHQAPALETLLEIGRSLSLQGALAPAAGLHLNSRREAAKPVSNYSKLDFHSLF